VGNFTDAAMLIPLTADFHLAALPFVEDVPFVSIVVFCGLVEFPIRCKLM
jgi:hypothetical protein